MANTITQAEYGSLASRLFDLLLRVKTNDLLLKAVSLLLDAEVAVLVERGATPPHNAEVMETYPSNRLDWTKQHLDALRWWDGPTEPSNCIYGYPLQKNLTVADEEFPDALVAFGGALPRKRPHIHELLIFQRHGARHQYSTYQCAIAATLLRQYELISEKNAMLEASKKAKDNYAALLSLVVLSESDWNDFLQRVEKEDRQKLERAEFMGPAAIISHAYMLWNRSRLIDEKQKKRPYEWLKKQPEDKGWHLYQNLADDFGLPASHSKHRALKATTVSDILKAIGQVNDDNGLSSEVWKAALIALEHGWRVVYNSILNKREPDMKLRSEEPSIADLDALLHLTNKLAVDDLVNRHDRDKKHNPIGRDTLQIYFAVLLCNAQRLNKHYMRIKKAFGDDHRQVADEVHREYVLNLSRFILGVVRIMQQRSKLKTEPSAVSPIEVLDGLLYMVDRFVHVELGVDERLHFREHLGRGIAAEVKRHFDQRFYRDHLIHVIDVFILGHLLLSSRARWKEVENQPLVDYIAKMDGGDSSSEVGHGSAEYLLRDWAVAALLHDLDYQLLEPPKKWDDNETADRFFELPRSVNIKWVDIAKLNDLPWKERLGQFIACCSERCDLWLPAPETYEITGHGVLSALRVAQLLAHADCEGLIGTQSQDLPLVRSYQRSLHAIAHHDLFNHIVHFETHPLSCLLRLCDELQEWGRPRVNIEKMVKHLYLQIEQKYGAAFESRESLALIDANLQFESDGNDGLFINIKGGKPEIDFVLAYSNPLEAQYDAITTFLCKAYNLQQVKLSREKTKPIGMKWRLLMRFPRPKEYDGMTELDIYGLLRDRVRVLPELLCFKNADDAEAGLVWLTERSPKPELDNTDCVAIIVTESSDPKIWYGRQTCDPGKLRSLLIDLKRKLLTQRALGSQQGLLIWPEA